MIDLTRIIGALAASFFKSRAALQLENAALRHQINVLRRSRPKRISFTNLDRFIFTTLYRLWPKIVGSIAIVRPKTLVRWHRQGFRLYWRWKCGGKGGRPKVPQVLRELIREMSKGNPLWGLIRGARLSGLPSSPTRKAAIASSTRWRVGPEQTERRRG